MPPSFSFIFFQTSLVDSPLTSDRASSPRLGPADGLSIKVFGVPALEQTVRVSNSGKIHVTHVGIVSVGGLTTAVSSNRSSRANSRPAGSWSSRRCTSRSISTERTPCSYSARSFGPGNTC